MLKMAKNALKALKNAAGIELLNVAESNPDVRAVVLTGHGGHFCGGGDLQRLSQQRVHDLAGQGPHLDAFHQWIEALRSFPKPVIAAVEGVAAGGGMSLVLACDLVVAADNARFLSAYSQVGLSPDGGASWHLTRTLGRSQALAQLWLGTPQTAQEWAAQGLVHRLCPAGDALAQALALADQLATVPAGVLASIKEPEPPKGLKDAGKLLQMGKALWDMKPSAVRSAAATLHANAASSQQIVAPACTASATNVKKSRTDA